jgi:transposase-like protein
MNKERRTFTAEQKAEAVLESFQRDTTLDAVCKKYGIYHSLLLRWRKEFRDHLPDLFVDKRSPAGRAKAEGYPPGESPEELKRIIGDLTVQNEILKKVQGLWGSGRKRR